MDDTKLTPLQELEREALLLDRQAILLVISALRKYRHAAQDLLKSRYQDGEVDAVALHIFSSTLEDIEYQNVS